MYCVKCGVELADSERVCPLCKTPVYFPDLDPNPETPYPKGVEKSKSNQRTVTCFILTFFFVIFAAVPVICNLNLDDKITWSGISLGGVLLAYIVIILPAWFKHPSPAIFVPCDFLAVALYLHYINYYVGGDWFLSFAFPVTTAAGVICTTIWVLAYYLKKGRLYIAAGAVISIGAFCMFLEFFLHYAFHIHDKMAWSLYPATIFTLFGLMLIIIAIVRPIKEQLTKLFSF